MARINLRSKFIYIPAAIVVVALIAAAAWWLSVEHLPGYNTEPIQKSSFVEPGGKVSEYFTGTVVKSELSIIGPKLTVKVDTTESDRTFFLASTAQVWLGLIFEDKAITGKEQVTFSDIKAGQRVAVFIGPSNTAKQIHILKR
jgi:hypothetical protein